MILSYILYVYNVKMIGNFRREIDKNQIKCNPNQNSLLRSVT